MPSPKATRHRFEVQGYLDLTDQDIKEIGSWIQFTPAVNAALVTVGILIGSWKILGVLAFLMGIGSVFAFHPFDLLYNGIVRFVTRTKALPPSGVNRRFVFSVECIWLLITAWLFRTAHFGAAFTMGCLILAVLLLLMLSNICVISELLNKMSGSSGRKR